MSGTGERGTGEGGGGKVKERGKGGKTASLLSGGPGRQKYHCDVCNILQISYDLKHHYSSKTEWKKLERLQNGVKLEVVVKEMGDIDPHTRYMWENKHNRKNLPSYLTHKREKTVRSGPMDLFLGRRETQTETQKEGDSDHEERAEGDQDREEEERGGDRGVEREELEDSEEERGGGEREGGEGSKEDELVSLEETSGNEDDSAMDGAFGDGCLDEEEEHESDENNNSSGSEVEVEELELGRKRRRTESKENENVEEIQGKMSVLEIESVAEKIAEILERKSEEKKSIAEKKLKIEENWVTGDMMLVCRPCLLYSKNQEVPPHYRIGNRGASGTIQRKNRKGKTRELNVLKFMCGRHEKTNLHIWCQMKEKKEEIAKKSYKERNEAAGLLVVRTAIKTLKRGGGSQDFMADLDLLSLTPGVIYAVKNNSRMAFFDIREATFEVVSEKMRTFFKKINHIAVSLDKVTVHHISYCVIITYFFWDGKLHVILNELAILTVDDYDSVGTAAMVIRSITSTTGFTRTQLANRLRHFRLSVLSV